MLVIYPCYCNVGIFFVWLEAPEKIAATVTEFNNVNL